MLTEITTPPIVNTRATRALHPKQSLIQDSGSLLHSNQNKYSCVPIAEELPELFEVQDCYLPYLLLHLVVCIRRACSKKLHTAESADLYILYTISSFLCSLMLISLFSTSTSFILVFILLGALLPHFCINTCVFRLE